MDKKIILILGGGAMQIPAIKAAKEMGWITIVADGVKNVPGCEFTDYFENIDLQDSAGMISTALKYKNSTGLDGVFTAGTDFTETVARVADAAGLPGISIESAVNASNKWKMREVFKTYNIPSPLFITIGEDSVFNCKSLEKYGLKFPLVVKPVDNMGSRGIRRTDNCSQLKAGVDEALTFSKSGKVIIEEYLEGMEFSIDALIYNNEISICGFADRNIYYPPYFIEMGHTLPSKSKKELSEQIIKTFKTAVKALGITEGAAKGDIRLSRGKIYIGEVAARLSGGYMSGWTFPYSTGINLTKEALKIAVGEAPGSLESLHNRTSAERAFLSIPGIVKSIDGIEDAGKDRNIKEVFLRINTGDKVKFPENNVEKAGNFIGVSKDRLAAVKSAEKACRKIFIRLEACNKITEEFIFGKVQSWVEDAFVLREKENIEFLESMPDFKFCNQKVVKIISLPLIKGESGCDWHGKSMDRAFKEVFSTKYNSALGIEVKVISLFELSGLVYNNIEFPNCGIVLGKLFYSAFLRAGVQGGVWVIDSILTTIKKNKSLLELFSRWKKY